MTTNPVSIGSFPTHQRWCGESAKAFAAFQAWLDLGPSRSLPAVAQQLSKSLALLKRWSATYAWAERLRSFEAEQAQIQCEADMAAARQRAEEREARRAEMEEDAYATYLLIKKRLNEMLTFPLAKKVVIDLQLSKDGRWEGQF